ncbi:MAG: FAD-dependent oxidoreductase, partial [Cyclobacteriaceae bacterium]
LQLETEVKEFISDENGHVNSVITADGKAFKCSFVGLTAGVHPNTDLVRDTGIETDRGILVNDHLETSVPGIFAIGDCAQLRTPAPGRKAIEPVWYTGRMMGEIVAQNIIGNKKSYQPGPWFNSAKFFDIEFQTYGNVEPVCPDNEEEIYWQHSDDYIAVHIRFNKVSNKLAGLNLFGIRMRHDLIDRWLRNGILITEFMDLLEQADFNPEFSTDHWNEVRKAFNLKFPEKAVREVKKRKKVFGLF